jgi:GH24 family phage-related lysozyme (muramidase)
MTSLGFNIAGGPRALPQKAPELWANLLAGNVAGAAQEFLDIDHALVNGKPTELPGLKARRQAEAAMFLGHDNV